MSAMAERRNIISTPRTAEEFLDRHKIKLSFETTADNEHPWGDELCRKGHHSHHSATHYVYHVKHFAKRPGERYQALDGMVENMKGGPKIEYWARKRGLGPEVTPTDDEILKFACIMLGSPKTPDAVFEEALEMTGYRMYPLAATKLASTTERLRLFFTPEEYDDLKKMYPEAVKERAPWYYTPHNIRRIN